MPKRPAEKFAIVLVTAPDLETARRLARAALTAKLVACANLVRTIESHYWWNGKVQSSREVLVLFKTTGASLRKLEQSILADHPYDTPEFVVLKISGANKRYLDWWKQSVA